MSYGINRIKHIEPSIEDFEEVKSESALRTYKDQLVQLYFPSEDPKKISFSIGRIRKTKTSKREAPGTDKLDFAIYLKEALDRPELVFDSYLYLEKKDEFGTASYVPRILSKRIKFVLMEDNLEKLEEYLKKKESRS